MDGCTECKDLDSALAAAGKRRDAAYEEVAPLAGGWFRIVDPQGLMEYHETRKSFDEVKKRRSAHIKLCAQQN
jgi:hypothetical protein